MFCKIWSLFLLSLVVSLDMAEAKKKIGHLQTKTHAVKGTVYILSRDQILIKQFKFSGKKCYSPSHSYDKGLTYLC